MPKFSRCPAPRHWKGWRRGTKGTPRSIRRLAFAGDYRGLWVSLLAALPECSDGCGRPSRFRTTYTGQFTCGMTDRGCAEPDGDEWEDAPWRAHVEAAAALADRGAR
jgi:hypothetical protein